MDNDIKVFPVNVEVKSIKGLSRFFKGRHDLASRRGFLKIVINWSLLGNSQRQLQQLHAASKEVRVNVMSGAFLDTSVTRGTKSPLSRSRVLHYLPFESWIKRRRTTSYACVFLLRLQKAGGNSSSGQFLCASPISKTSKEMESMLCLSFCFLLVNIKVGQYTPMSVSKVSVCQTMLCCLQNRSMHMAWRGERRCERKVYKAELIVL